jgi:chromosome segregation ATPase
MFRSMVIRGLLVILVTCCGSGPIAAQTASPDAASSRALARAQALLKQLNAQKVAAEAELAKVRSELTVEQASLTKARAKLKTQGESLAGAEARLAATTRQKQRTEQSLTSSRTRLKQTATALKNTRENLHATEAERQRLASELAATREQLADAERKNGELYRASTELLEEFSSETTLQRLFRSEPITGIRRVQLENLQQDYAHRLDDNQRKDPAAATPVP